MYLSSRDIKWAIECGKLIVNPPPEHFGAGYDETSIDVHLGPVSQAKVWTTAKLVEEAEERRKKDIEKGRPPHSGDPIEVYIGQFKFDPFARSHQIAVPEMTDEEAVANNLLVYRRSNEIVVKKFGFLLWQTKEIIGTPRVNPDDASGQPKRHPELICFVNAKSTMARTGLLVHFTAPTIHAGWDGTVTLEISNLGPFTFVLKEDDPLAQLTVATISSAPDITLKKNRSKTQGQSDPSGSPPQ